MEMHTISPEIISGGGMTGQLIHLNLGNLLRHLCSGHADATDAQRLKQFQRLSSSSSNKRHPKYILGHEEPDCTSGGGSSGMGVDEGVREWERLIAPLKGRGTKIGSPSMCSKYSIEYLYGKMRIYHSVCFQSRRMRRSSKNLRAKFRCPGILLRFMLT